MDYFFIQMDVLYFKVKLYLGTMTFTTTAKLSTVFYDNRLCVIFFLEVTIFSEIIIPSKEEDMMGYLDNHHGSNYQTWAFACHDIRTLVSVDFFFFFFTPAHFISAPQNTCGCDSKEVMLTVTESCIFKGYTSQEFERSGIWCLQGTEHKS